jgi:hypothetical protein
MRFQLEFSEFALQISSLDDGKVIQTAQHQLTSINDDLKVSEAKEFIKEFTKSSFLHSADYTCFFRCSQLTLVPNSIYDEQLMVKYFELSFGPCNNPSSIHSHTNIPLGITCIYQTTAWVNAFCLTNFPDKTIHASQQSYLNINQDSANLELQGCICFDDASFYLQLFQKGKLLYSQETAIMNSDDLIYFTSASLKKLPIDIFRGKIILYPRQDKEIDTSIQENFKRISEFKDIQFILSNFEAYQNELLCE